MIDLSEKLHNLDQQNHYSFYTDNGDIRLYSHSFENGEFFGEQWEAQFEGAIKHLAADSIGHLMVAIGTQLIFSRENMHDFDQKMERFGEQIEQIEQIEQRVKYQATALKQKANTLCLTLAQVDFAESQLQQIQPLVSLDVIRLQDQSDKM
jgi:hypothetical protein